MKLRARHKRLARDDRYFPDVELTRDPEVLRARLIAYAKRRKVRLIERPGFTPHGRRWSMTIGKRIYLRAGFYDRSMWYQCAVLAHELVHALLVKAWGVARFLWRWSQARWRWAIETLAYRMTYRIHRLHMTTDRIDNAISARVRTMRKAYRLGRIRKSQYERETRAVLYLG